MLQLEIPDREFRISFSHNQQSSWHFKVQRRELDHQPGRIQVRSGPLFACNKDRHLLLSAEIQFYVKTFQVSYFKVLVHVRFHRVLALASNNIHLGSWLHRQEWNKREDHWKHSKMQKRSQWRRERNQMWPLKHNKIWQDVEFPNEENVQMYHLSLFCTQTIVRRVELCTFQSLFSLKFSSWTRIE